MHSSAIARSIATNPSLPSSKSSRVPQDVAREIAGELAERHRRPVQIARDALRRGRVLPGQARERRFQLSVEPDEPCVRRRLGEPVQQRVRTTSIGELIAGDLAQDVELALRPGSRRRHRSDQPPVLLACLHPTSVPVALDRTARA